MCESSIVACIEVKVVDEAVVVVAASVVVVVPIKER